MSLHWQVEANCSDGFEIKIVYNPENDEITIIDTTRPLKVDEIVELKNMVLVMNKTKYIKMECTKL